MPPGYAPWWPPTRASYEQAEHEYGEAIRLDHDSARTYLDFARLPART